MFWEGLSRIRPVRRNHRNSFACGAVESIRSRVTRQRVHNLTGGPREKLSALRQKFGCESRLITHGFDKVAIRRPLLSPAEIIMLGRAAYVSGEDFLAIVASEDDMRVSCRYNEIS